MKSTTGKATTKARIANVERSANSSLPTNGRTLRYTRRYRTCNRKLKPSNRLERKEAV